MAVQGRKTMKNDVIKVVIVTYNSADDIAKCLDALLLSSERYSLEITVVDNGSTDETVKQLRGFYPFVHVIANINLGYAHGNNLGVQEALGNGREYKAILILNPDTTLCVGSVDRLADVLFSFQEVGGVSPHMRGEQERNRVKSLFGSPLNDRPLMNRDVVVSDRLHGCCMLLRPDVFRKIGFIDEQYFLYWEEVDFGLQAIAAGFKLLLCYDVLMDHRCGSPERQHRIYYMWRNQFRFARKNFPPLLRLIFLSRRVPTFVRELIGFVGIRRFDLVRAALSGMTAGLLGETGKSSNRYAGLSNG
jgi:hypothetical protein